MNSSSRVLVVDDQAGDIRWLLDLITSRGYTVDLATNQEAAMRQLDQVKSGAASYALAIFDVMVAIKDLMDLVEIDEDFFEESRDTGIRLCRYARKDLGIPVSELPIACLTVREDDEVEKAMRELGIPLFNRTPNSPSESIRSFLDRQLPKRAAEPDDQP